MAVLLAIDCTQSPINIAAGWDGTVHGQAIGPVQRNAADNLLEIIEQALQQAGKSKDNIAGIVAITGPGSFTGIRVGISFAHSFGFARNIPIYGLTAFDILSSVSTVPHPEEPSQMASRRMLNREIQLEHPSRRACSAPQDEVWFNSKKLIIVESKRAELYAQFYQGSAVLGAPLMADVAELTALAVLENAAIVAPQNYEAVFAALPNSFFYDPAQLSILALMAAYQLQPAARQTLAPFYIRPPDAVPQNKAIN